MFTSEEKFSVVMRRCCKKRISIVQSDQGLDIDIACVCYFIPRAHKCLQEPCDPMKQKVR